MKHFSRKLNNTGKTRIGMKNSIAEINTYTHTHTHTHTEGMNSRSLNDR